LKKMENSTIPENTTLVTMGWLWQIQNLYH
jgi:hypothetical protein